MPKEYLNRAHGDGSLRLEKSVSESERELYLQTLQRILKVIDLDFNLNKSDEVEQTLLALKQRIALGFSNGCPSPEKVIINFIKEQGKKLTNLAQLTELILESGRSDAQCNFLYQEILKYANRTLRSELQLLKPTEKIDGQEDQNLPTERTADHLIAGMASDLVFFNILVPLRDFIVKAEDQQITYNQVLRFLIKASQESKSIEELKEKTGSFLILL